MTYECPEALQVSLKVMSQICISNGPWDKMIKTTITLISQHIYTFRDRRITLTGSKKSKRKIFCLWKIN